MSPFDSLSNVALNLAVDTKTIGFNLNALLS